MPYVRMAYTSENTAERLGIPDRVISLNGGLNFRPVLSVVFKAEYSYAFFADDADDPTGLSKREIQFLDTQLAWAF